MRRIVAILLAALSGLALYTAYIQVDAEQRAASRAGIIDSGTPVLIPDGPRFSDPEKTFAALQSAATSARVNVARTILGTSTGGTPTTVHYVFITHDGGFGDNLAVRDGRWLTSNDMSNRDACVSSQDRACVAQVGTLDDFGGNDVIEVRPMVKLLASTPAVGTYVVDVEGSEMFKESLARELGQRYGLDAGVRAEDLTPPIMSAGGHTGSSAGRVLSAVLAGLIGVTSLVITYGTLKQAKVYAVLSMTGHTTVRVWARLIGNQIMAWIVVSGVASLVAFIFIPDAVPTFPARAMLTVCIAGLAFGAFSTLATLHLRRMPQSAALRNRVDTLAVFFASGALKLACSVAAVLATLGLVLQAQRVSEQISSLSGWDRARGYGIFYPTSVGDDLGVIQSGGNGPTTSESHELYEELNAVGALYVDAGSLEPGVTAEEVIPTATVNPNYLNRFPLRDTSGQAITIAEAERDWIVLVPETYKSRSAELAEYFKDRRSGDQGPVEAENTIFGRSAPAYLADQRVRLVWTGSGQGFFTFNPKVSPETGNVVTDPIVEVVTLANSVGADRMNAVTGGPEAGLKVKLGSGDTEETRRSLRGLLESLHLDDNLRHLVTMDEYAAEQLSRLRVEQHGLAVATSVLLLGAGLMLFQGVVVLFSREARRIVVRRLFGFSLVRKYRDVLLLLGSVWGLQTIGAVLLSQMLGSPLDRGPDAIKPSVAAAATLALVLTVCEAFLALALLAQTERRNAAAVLKGEF